MPALLAIPVLTIFGMTVTVGNVILVGMIGASVGTTIYGNMKRKAALRAAMRDAERLKGWQTMEVQADAPRRLIFGRARTSGPIVFAHVTDNKRTLHLIVPVAAHEVDSTVTNPERWFVDGVPVSLTGDNGIPTEAQITGGRNPRKLVMGPFAYGVGLPSTGVGVYEVVINSIKITTVISQPTTPDLAISRVFLDLSASWNPAWGSVHILQGQYYRYIYIIPFIDLLITAGTLGYPAHYFAVDDGSPATTYGDNRGRIYWRSGTETQNAIPQATGGIGSKWQSSHRLLGHAYFYARLFWGENLFTQMPNIEALVRGMKVRDPRSGFWPNDNPQWSENPALVLLHLMLMPKRSGGWGVPLSSIDVASFAAAANICDETVLSIPASGSKPAVTESRYTFNGVLEITGSLMDRVEPVLRSMAGSLYYTGGKYVLKAGAWVPPSRELTEADLRGAYQWESAGGRQDSINGVRGTYVEARDRISQGSYQSADFLPLQVPEYVAEDGGVEQWAELSFPNTNTGSMARRLAKIHLEKARRKILLSFPAKLTALDVRAGDTVEVTLDRMGWDRKTFECVRSQIKVSPEDGETGIDLTLRETDENVFAWATANAVDWGQTEAAPATDLPSFADVAPPGAPEISERIVFKGIGRPLEPSVDVTWEPSPDAFVTGYELSWRGPGDVNFLNPVFVRGTEFTVGELFPGPWDFRVRAMNTAGAFSPWMYRFQVEIFGLMAKPAAPTGFSVAVLTGMGVFSWGAATDLDVIHGGTFRLRYQDALENGDWDDARDLVTGIPGTATTATAPLPGAGTYFLKAVDAWGNESEQAASVVITNPDVLRFDAVHVEEEEPDWAGVRTNVYEDDGKLYLEYSLMFDDWPDIDSVPMWDRAGGTLGGGEYEVAWDGGDEPYFDLGETYVSRVSHELDYIGYDETNTFDERSDNIDLWPDFDGLLDAGAINARLYVRTTEDDPSGSPEWSDWREMIGPVDLAFRAIQSKLVITSQLEIYQIEISRLAIFIDMPERIERGHGTVIPATGDRVSYTHAFRTVPALSVTIKEHANNTRWQITNADETGFDIIVYDGVTPEEKPIDWIAVGAGKVL